jgi:arginine:ornithine antiporter/lysine permease
MCSILFVPGILVYLRARREAGVRAFTAVEAIIAGVILALGVYAGWLLWTGQISPL